jgi:CBS-domain-containing membrane protein
MRAHRERQEAGHDLHWQLGHTPVSALMKPAITIAPDDELESLTALMLGQSLDCLLVVGQQREPIGLVHAVDLLQQLAESADTEEEVEEPQLRGELHSGFHVHTIVQTRAVELMCPIPVTVVETQSITTAAWLLGIEQAVWAPVLTRRGKLAGMLSALDVLRWIAATDGTQAAPPEA